MRRLAHLLLRRRKATRMASTTSREVTAAPQTTKATASTSLAPALSDEDKAWLRGLPKVELHVHLDGSFDSSMLYAAARKAAAEGTLPEAVPSAVNGKPLRVGELVGGCSTEGQFRSLCQCKGKRSLLAMIDCFQVSRIVCARSERMKARLSWCRRRGVYFSSSGIDWFPFLAKLSPTNGRGPTIPPSRSSHPP